MRFAIGRFTSMSLTAFTIEIHPRAWYALANLPKEVYERIKRGVAGVAENAAYSQEPGRAVGGFLSLDGYVAHYEIQPERRCVTVLDIARSTAGRAHALQPGGVNVLSGTAAPAAEGLRTQVPHNVLVEAAPPADAGAASTAPAQGRIDSDGEAAPSSPPGSGLG